MTPSTDCRCGEYPVQRSVRYRTVQLGASRPGGADDALRTSAPQRFDTKAPSGHRLCNIPGLGT
jgi:hypothetical protein